MDLKSRLDMPTIGKRISTNINKNHSSDGGQQVIHILMYIERVRAYKKNISRRWSACENAHTFTSSTYSRNSEEVTVHRRCCEQAFNFTEHLSDRSTLPSKNTNKTSRSGAAHHTEQYQAILRPRDGGNLGHQKKMGRSSIWRPNSVQCAAWYRHSGGWFRNPRVQRHSARLVRACNVTQSVRGRNNPGYFILRRNNPGRFGLC